MSNEARRALADARWLGTIAAWNPVSSTVTAARELFGYPPPWTDPKTCCEYVIAGRENGTTIVDINNRRSVTATRAG